MTPETLRRLALVLTLLLVAGLHAHAQFIPQGDGTDPCGYPDTATVEYRTAARLNWGYGYDSLLADLGRWGTSPYVRVESIGASVQNRLLYMLTIQDTVSASTPRKRVWIHARTHPNEVQGTWVTNEIIKELLSNSPMARRLRDSCVFNILPMYNPDGVELRLPRQNANGIDIESNWSANPPQPEVQVLRSRFTQLMSEPNPIRVALNVHSANDCLRYFVYHTAAGTTTLYATMQQSFIGYVRSQFPGGIQPYTYFQSWPSQPPPTYYPESWFWYNHHENVLALTYEDKNCAAAGGFDSTARAMLHGVGDHLNVFSTSGVVAASGTSPGSFSLGQNFPNPFNPETVIPFSVSKAGPVDLSVFDIHGRMVKSILNGGDLPPGSYHARWNGVNEHGNQAASGVYLVRMKAGNEIRSVKISLLK